MLVQINKMKPILFLFAIPFSIAASAQNEAHVILRQTCKAIKSHESISYFVERSFKGCDRPDTMRYYADASLLRVPEDKDFGGMIYVAPLDNTYSFYNLQKVYNVNKYRVSAQALEKTVDDGTRIKRMNGKNVVYKVKPVPPHYTSLGPNFVGALVWNGFLKPDRYLKYINEDEIGYLGDTTIHKHRCYEIYVQHYADTSIIGDEEILTVLYIDKEDLTPIYTREWVKIGSTFQYTDFYLKSYEYDDVDKSRFSRKQIPAIYKLKE